MPLPGRKRASLGLLLVLVAGLAAAGAAAASASMPEMACCPAGSAAPAQDCTWLGAGDCCPERPAATTSAPAAPPAPAASAPLAPSAAQGAPAALPAAGSWAPPSLRSTVLRL
jgi:hypothetical protein